MRYTRDPEGKKKAIKGTQWRARWRTPDGHQRSQNFPTREAAERHLVSVEHSKLTGSYVDPSEGKVTFKSYAESWRAVQTHRPGTAAQIETNLRRHVYPHIGDRPIGAIRPSEIRSWVKAISTPGHERKALAPATVELIYTWTATIFGAAVTDRVIAATPCQGIRRPEVPQSRIEPPTVETVEKLLEAIPGRYRALIVLGAGTGLRISEALGLTNDRVDWIRRTLTVDRQLASVNGEGQPCFGPVKDRRNRARTIPLPQVVVDALAAHVAEFGLGPEGLLFTAPEGGALRRQKFSEVWSRTARPLGIPTGDGFHLLRHFYASLLIRAGESVKTVQERLGHTSATMTLDIYGHLWPGDEDRTRAAVDSVLGAGLDTKLTQEDDKPGEGSVSL